MSPEILVPVIMGVALLWWIGRDMQWQTMLLVAIVTLVIVIGVLAVQNMTVR